MKIEEAIQEYMIQLKVIDNKSSQTIVSYEHDLRLYQSFLNAQHIENMEDITILKVDAFFHEYLKSHKSRSANRTLSALRSFHEAIHLNHPDIMDPIAYYHSFGTGHHLPTYCSVQDVMKLLESFGNTDMDVFQRTILETLYSCGLRVSELCNLELNDIRISEKICKVAHGKGDKERIVPIAQACVEQMQLYLNTVRVQWDVHHSSKFFINRRGNPINRQYVHRLIKKKVAENHLDSKLSAHSFRHSFATHLLDGNADLRIVQELLGHSNIQTTQIYTHIQNKRLSQAYEEFFPDLDEEGD